MTWISWRKTDPTLEKQVRNALDMAEECQHDVTRLSRRIDELLLDMSALYDKVNAALARISTRERRAKADDSGPMANGGPASAEVINQLILDGTYDGGLDAGRQS